MAQALNRLTARTVANLKEAGRYADGGGLYLQIGPTGTKAWLFMYKVDGKRREMGLGSLADVSLSEARQKAADARRTIAEGQDPLGAKRAAQGARKAQEAHPTFGVFADQMLASKEHGWSNEKHRAQWRMTLSVEKAEDGSFKDSGYCLPLRQMRLDQISTDDVLAILQPVWLVKSETASRLRGRIEAVLDAAKARGLRSGENPAQWRGHLDTLLPKRPKLQRGHHAALPYVDMPAFVAELRTRDALAARVLEFCILTAARSGEVLGATWDEIDLDAKVWSVPAHRMKAGRDHRTPLSDAAMAILKAVAPLRPEADGSAFLFPGQRPSRPLSGMAMEMLLRRQGKDITVHGFRSSFRDWAAEETSYPREVAEAALAHVVGDATERAYRRGDALEKRRALMEAWASYCSSGISQVSEI